MKRILYLLLSISLLATTGFAQSGIYGTTQIFSGGHIGVYGSLTFVNGYVVTPRVEPTANISFQPGSSWGGASDVSHVDGYAEKVGNTAFTFPVGNGAVYRPAGISPPASGTFSAAYFGSSPSAATLPTGAPFSTASLGTGVTAVSTAEYWDINGPSAVNLTLSWNAASNLNTLTGSTLANLVIVGWDGTKWVNLGGTATGTLSGTGTITTTTAVTPDTYTAYTFGSVTNCATPSVGGTVSYAGALPLCSLSNAGSLTLTGQTGAVTGWETSTDGGVSFTAIAGTAGQTYYTFVNAANNQRFRAVVNNGGVCSPANATAVTITTSPTACSSATCDNTTGTIVLTQNGLQTAANLTNQVILTDAAGTIQYTSAPNSLTVTGIAPGNYIAYRLLFDNTQAPVPTLTVGTNLTAIGGACVKYSNQLAYKICPPAPTVAILAPANGITVSTANPPISGTATPGSTVTLTAGPGSTGGPCIVTASISGTYACASLTLVNGPTSVTAITSNAGGTSSPAVSSFTVNACATPSVGGTVAYLGTGPLCSLSNAGSLTLTGQSGAVTGWETSINGGISYTAIAGMGSKTFYNFINAQNGQLYRAIVNGGTGCTSASATPASIATSSTACTSTVCDKIAPDFSIGVISSATGPNLTNQVILTDASGTIQYVSTPNSNSLTGVLPADYLAYQVTFDNTQTPLPTLTVGTSLTAVGGACVKYSNQLAIKVCGLPTVAILSPANNTTQPQGTNTISGTATPGATVVLTGPVGTTLGTVTADGSGTYAVTGLNLPPGVYSVTAVASNANGTSSPAVSSFTITNTFVPPGLAVTGPVNVLTSLTPTVSGTATPGSPIVITGPGNTTLCSTTATVSGTFSCSVSVPAGPNTLTVTASGPGGTTSLPTTFTALAPPTVAINTPADGSQTNLSPVVSGTATPNSSLTLTAPGNAPVVVTVSPTGSWTAPVGSLTFVAGPNSVTAITSNAGGLSNTAVTNFTAIAPPTVAINSPANGSPTTLSPVVSGTATPNSSVTVTAPGNPPIVVTTSPTGQWTTPVGSLTLVPGPNSITAIAGNPGGVSSPATTSVTAIAPPTIAINSPANNALVNLTTVVSGTATASSSVTLTGPNGQLCQTTASVSGTWSCTVNLTAGPQTLSAVTSNLGGLSNTATVGLTVLAPPTVQILTPPNGSTVAVTTTISGTATPGSIVNVTGNGNVLLCVKVADLSGNFSCPVLLQPGSNTITAIASSVAGTSAPDQVTVTALTPPTLAVTSPMNILTNLTPVVSGTATPFTPITITGPGNVTLCSTTASASGSFACPVTVPAGPNTLTVTAANVAGSVSAPTTFTALVPPTVAINTPANGSQTNLSPVVSGTATPGSSLTLTSPGNAPVVVTVSPSGSWTAPAGSLTFVAGPNSITAITSNAGGMSNTAVTSFTAIAPPTVAITSPNGIQTNLTPVISGTATPNAVVMLTGGPGSTGGPISVTASPTGSYSAIGITFPAGPNSVTAIATNVGGTSSPAVTSFTAVAGPTVAINSPVNNSQTNLSPVVSGTATPNSSVTLTAPGNPPIVVTTSPTGQWTTPVGSLTLAPGPNTLTAVAGNPGGVSTPATTQVTALASPTVAIVTPANGGTATLSPVISGTATPNSVVTLTGGPGSTGGPISVTASPTGVYSATGITFPAGPNSVTAIASNPGGVSTPAVSSFTAIAPPTLAVTSPVNVSTTSSPVISGTATPGAVITITNPAGQTICQTTASTTGAFACGPVTGLPTGPNQLTITASTPGGTVSQPINFTTVVPPTVAINTPADGSQTNLTPVISGTATPNSSLTLTSPGNAPVFVTVSPTGSWTAPAGSLTFVAGPNAVTAITGNAGGTSSPAVTGFTTVAAPGLTVTGPVNVLTTLTPTVSGTATPNSPITITGPGNVTLCSTTASSSGTFACPVSVPAGPNTLTVTATTPGGTTSVPTTFTAVAPPTIAINSPANGSPTTLSPVVSGTATPNSSVTVTAPGNPPIVVTTSPTGQWSTPVGSLTLAPGPNSITAVAGNPGGVSTPATTSVNALSPPTVQILSPPTGSTVAITTVVSGTATPGSTVNLSGNGSVQLCAVVADLSGNFSCLVGLVPGTNTITAIASNLAGTSAPDRVTVTAVAAPSLTVVQPGPLTNLTPTISGTTTPNSVVVITGPGPVTLCSTTASASGSFACPVSVPAGPNTLTVTANNPGGTTTVPVSFTALAPPTVAIVTPANGGTATLSPVISGTATPNSVVTLTGGPGSTGGPVSVTASPTGVYSAIGITFPAGANSVTAVATNAGGVSTPAVTSFTAIAPPTLAVTSPVNISTTSSPVISGTATPGAVITITNPAGQTICQTTASTTGAFACGPVTGLPTGPNQLTITASTPGGTVSQPIKFTTVVPPTVAITTPTNNSTQPAGTNVISGTATPGATVVLTTSTGQSLTTTASPTGTFSVTTAAPFPAGTQSVTAVATNVGGTSSPAVNSFTVASPPSLTVNTPPTGPTTPVISGTATPGSPVVITGPGNTTLCSTTANASGVFACPVTVPVGPSTLTVTASGPGGTTSMPVNISALAPPTVAINTPANGSVTNLTPVISGTATPNSSLTLTAPGNAPVVVTVSPTGSWTAPVGSLTFVAGPNSVTVITGNAGGLSNTAVTSFTTTARPTVAINGPVNGSQTNLSPVVSGTATPNSSVTVTAPGNPPIVVTTSPTGQWSTPVGSLTLTPGPNSITAIAGNVGGVSTPATTSVNALSPPTVQILSPPTGSTAAITTVVSGTATPGSTVNLANGAGQLCAVVADLSGNFACTVVLQPGSNTITAVASNLAGISQPDRVTVTAVMSPTLTIATLGPLTNLTPTVSGTATPFTPITITGPGNVTLCSTTASASGTFACPVTVPAGPNTLTVTASNPAGSVSVPVSFTALAPPTVAIVTPANGGTATLSPVISGTATPNAVVTLTGGPGSTGGPISVIASPTGSYSAIGINFPAGPNSVTAISTNAGGVSTPAVSSFTAIAPVSARVAIPLRVYLQGAMITPNIAGLMRDDLRVKNKIPTVEPYTALSYTHTGGGGGESIPNPATVLANRGANSIVDWVVVEVRSASSPGVILATRSGLLQTDGDVVDVDGVSSLTFGSAVSASGSYYLAVHHRNHLGVMTAMPVSVSVGAPVIDFSNPATATYQFPVGDLRRMSRPQTVEGGVRSMWAGNTTGDSQVILQGPDNDVDKVFFDVLNDPGNGSRYANYVRNNVYSTNDVNMDGLVIAQGPTNEVDFIFFEILNHPDNLGQYLNFIIRQQVP